MSRIDELTSQLHEEVMMSHVRAWILWDSGHYPSDWGDGRGLPRSTEFIQWLIERAGLNRPECPICGASIKDKDPVQRIEDRLAHIRCPSSQTSLDELCQGVEL